jgi:Ca2+-binding RTX toxin-like protein
MPVFAETHANGWAPFYTPVFPSTFVDNVVNFAWQTGLPSYFHSQHTTGGTSYFGEFATYLSGAGNLSFTQPTPGKYAMIGGTVNDISYSLTSSTRFSGFDYGMNISGASYNAATIQSFIDAANADGLWRYLVAGDDTFYITDHPIPRGASEAAKHLVYAGAGNDSIYSTTSVDGTLIGGLGSNQIFFGSGNDFIWAGEKDAAGLDAAAWSTASGGGGNDYLAAGFGSNTVLSGGSGNDYIFDGAGTDILDGGAGSDYLSAGQGTNVFRFGMDSNVSGESDLIVDFNNSTTNYIQLAAALRPVTFVGNYAGGAYIYIYGGETIYVVGALAEAVISHLFYV